MDKSHQDPNFLSDTPMKSDLTPVPGGMVSADITDYRKPIKCKKEIVRETNRTPNFLTQSEYAEVAMTLANLISEKGIINVPTEENDCIKDIVQRTINEKKTHLIIRRIMHEDNEKRIVEHIYVDEAFIPEDYLE